MWQRWRSREAAVSAQWLVFSAFVYTVTLASWHCLAFSAEVLRELSGQKLSTAENAKSRRVREEKLSICGGRQHLQNFSGQFAGVGAFHVG